MKTPDLLLEELPDGLTEKSLDDLLGNCSEFFCLQKDRLSKIGIDIAGLALSHLAYRPATFDHYLRLRNQLETHCVANVENVWNGRPISKLMLRESLPLGAGFATPMIELIPPPHREKYKMGLEHVGVVVGETIDDFANRHRQILDGQQFQNQDCEPYYVTFDDHSNVKFYSMSLGEVLVRQGFTFDGFYHA